MKHQVRVDLDGADGLVRHHLVYYDEPWTKIRHMGQQMSLLWQQDVKVTYSGIDEETERYRTEVFGHFRYEQDGVFDPVPIEA